jgi:hypothetical protein
VPQAADIEAAATREKASSRQRRGAGETMGCALSKPWAWRWI